MGAGVIPFAVHQQQVYFLLQKVFAGRKSGYLNDFGGGVKEGESYQHAAAREFVEETETMFFADDISTAQKTPERVSQQLTHVNHLFANTLNQHPHWWCWREPGNKIPPKDWKTFFIEFDYLNISTINLQWQIDDGQQIRFSKRRELHWLDADSLLLIYQHNPEKLWKRVRQLVNAQAIIETIKQEKLKIVNNNLNSG